MSCWWSGPHLGHSQDQLAILAWCHSWPATFHCMLWSRDLRVSWDIMYVHTCMSANTRLHAAFAVGHYYYYYAGQVTWSHQGHLPLYCITASNMYNILAEISFPGRSKQIF